MLRSPINKLIRRRCDWMNLNKVTFNVISTGSKGNAVVLNERVLVDCGVPFKFLTPYLHNIQLVLLTHIHSDHFLPTTVRLLAKERPTIRFGCGRWMVNPLLSSGIAKHRIDVLECDVEYDYGICRAIPVMLTHNVPNCGYHLFFPEGKVFYATDTCSLNGISARGYDLYLVEANYEDEIIAEKIREKKASGEYSYELQVLKNHLSKAKCDDFIYKNIGPTSEYVYLHCHVD